MPRGDGTGPAGMGPMTGRAAGYCAGYPVPGFMNPVGGRGWRHWHYATGLPGWARASYGWPAWGGYAPAYPGPLAPTMTAGQEVSGLKQQAEYFQNALDEINKRIGQLEAKSQE